MPRFPPFPRLWLAVATLAAPAHVFAAPATPQSVAGPDAAAAQGAVKGLVGAIRYGKDAAGLKRLGVDTMAQNLLGVTYERMDSADRNHFVNGFGELLVADAFVRGREMFHYLDALLFAAPARVGEQLHLACTIVVHRELKKVEIPVTWVLAQEKGSWKVVDIVAQNDSTLGAVRDEEVAPLIREGGVPKLLQTLDARLAKVKKAAPAPSPASGPAANPNASGRTGTP